MKSSELDIEYDKMRYQTCLRSLNQYQQYIVDSFYINIYNEQCISEPVILSQPRSFAKAVI